MGIQEVFQVQDIDVMVEALMSAREIMLCGVVSGEI
jgi:hypothetical protein